jgi:hypothetical protein
MPSTTNFGWTTPADTDLVKDGAAAIRTLGNGVDSSFVDLKGGTSGQILAKNSNTDLDFVWVANDQGDITAVTAGTGISGGGTSGAVTITNSMATEITASGDIIVGTGSGTFDNLPIGSTGQVLTADTTVSPYKVKWAAAAGGGKVLQVVQDTTTTLETTTSVSYIDTALSQAITPSAATSKVLVVAEIAAYSYSGGADSAAAYNVVRTSTQLAEAFLGDKSAGIGSSIVIVYLDSPNTTSATTYKVQMKKFDGDARIQGTYLSSLTLIEIGA